MAKEYEALFNEEYKDIENKITISVEEVDTPDNIIPEQIQDDFII